jgi:hypothetical protein
MAAQRLDIVGKFRIMSWSLVSRLEVEVLDKFIEEIGEKRRLQVRVFIKILIDVFLVKVVLNTSEEDRKAFEKEADLMK